MAPKTGLIELRPDGHFTVLHDGKAYESTIPIPPHFRKPEETDAQVVMRFLRELVKDARAKDKYGN